MLFPKHENVSAASRFTFLRPYALVPLCPCALMSLCPYVCALMSSFVTVTRYFFKTSCTVTKLLFPRITVTKLLFPRVTVTKLLLEIKSNLVTELYLLRVNSINVGKMEPGGPGHFN